jgi:hypothetical protein
VVRKQIRWAVFSAALLILGILMTADPALASIANVYIAQTPAGAQDGSSCANAHGVPFFNTAGNWGAGAAQIGPGTTVHLCGTFTGSANSTILQFQGSGASGNVVTLKFETGAILQAPYCGGNGCIDLNAKSYLLIDGGPTCGKLSRAVGATTACNGLIRNTLAGSSGKTCPGGACTYALTDTQSSEAIATSNSGAFSYVEVRNLAVGPMYVRDGTTGGYVGDGTAVGGISFSHSLPTHISVHNNTITGTDKDILISWYDNAFTSAQNDFQFYNNDLNDQCWTIGMGENSTGVSNSTVTGILIHDNEFSNWQNWVGAGAYCHGNGTMLFNYNGSPSNDSIGDATSMVYNNYIHGDLTGGYMSASASGFLSCQDNCGPVNFFNNLIVDTCTGICGGVPFYFQAGGAGQKVYNNTVYMTPGVGCINFTPSTTPLGIVKNNVFVGCQDELVSYSTSPTNIATSDYNVGYYSGGTSTWISYNIGAGYYVVSLATWQGTHGQDTHSSATNPSLDANYKITSTGSSAYQRGANLTSLGIAALDTDLAGNPRPSSGAWDAGAYQYSASVSSTQPSPPTGLQASAQ